MAFSFANVASEAAGIGGSSLGGPQVQDGDELKEIQTAQLGFKTINAETKVKLLPNPWPSEDLPIPTAQLLSVASSQRILAAAGPETLIIASTDGVRDALSAKEGENVRNVTPLLEIPHERLTHVAFSSDESVLVVSGPRTGGLLAYQVEKLRAGHAEVALRIDMQDSLRALVPNPNPQSAHLFAAVNANGELLVADLSTGNFAEGPNGTALAGSIACVCWSNRGKQLIAGNAAGNAVQLKPDGNQVAIIPKSTSIPNDVHMSAISWLEDDIFFTVYTSNSTSAEEGIPPSEYYIVERSNKTHFKFHKLPEILPPFGLERLPTHHFIARLRKFDPHIKEIVLLSATTATDIGIVSKSSEPLSVEDPVTNAYTYTTLEDDTRRAALPLSSESSLDTSPIGMAVDLSSKDPVINPLPTDPEIQETAGPVPNLLVLNNEGILCSWWVIYSESVKQKTTFSGFESLQKVAEVRSAVSLPANSESNQVSTTIEAISTFTNPSAQSSFSAPKLQTSSQPGFGVGASFGTSSKIGDNKSSWTSTGFGSNTGGANAGSAFGQSGFGQPAFGAPSAPSSSNMPAFGPAPTFGSRPSGFGGSPSGFGQPASAAFGKTGFGSNTTASRFAAVSGSSVSSGFASFANTGGFAAGAAKNDGSSQSSFAKPAIIGSFGTFANSSGFGSVSEKTDETKERSFAKSAASGAFSGLPQAAESETSLTKAKGSNEFGQTPAPEAFGTGPTFGRTTSNNKNSPFSTATPFKLESTFKGDGTAKDDLPAPIGGNTFGFGSGFENMLGNSKKDVSPVEDKETEMDDREDQESVSASETERPFTGFSPEAKKSSNEATKLFTTPPSTITQPKTTPAPPIASLFGLSQQQTTTPQQTPGGFSFASTTPQQTPAASHNFFGTKPIVAPTPAAVAKSEPVSSFNAVSDVQQDSSKEANSVEKADESPRIKTEPLSDNDDDEALRAKSIAEAPLPPDTISKPGYTTGDTSSSSPNSKDAKEPNDAPLPPDFQPANKSAGKEAEGARLPEDEHDADDDDFSSDFEDSGEDITQDISPVEEGEEGEEDHDEDATTEQIQTSPESSFKGGDTTSPTDGLFTKVSTNDALKPTRPLFGEVGRVAPIFPPPTNKIQQSPRSPSPVRNVIPHDTLRSDSRSVSAPIHPRTAIDQRKTDYSQSTIAVQAAKAREEEAARERARLEALKSATEQAKAKESQTLEDDKDERIQRELALPVHPSQSLDEFMTYQAGTQVESNNADIPAQIERLYQDINSMICTLGINARSLSAFMLYQRSQAQNQNWPIVLHSEAPLDAINARWSLDDICRLHEGSRLLATKLDQTQVQAVSQKLRCCQDLLTKDLFDLRTKITAIRKSLHVKAHGSIAMAPLSAEQASIQHDLRKGSATVQTKLVCVEDTLAVIRARLAELAPSSDNDKGHSISVGQNAQKKPTVEAVTNTVAKMMSMAEKKSADIDVLEAQLKKINSSLTSSMNGGGQAPEYVTPRRSRTSRVGGTPGSAASSIFYTPDSRVEASGKSTRSNGGNILSMTIVSAEDRDRWQAKARRKKDVATALKAVLEGKRKKALTSA